MRNKGNGIWTQNYLVIEALILSQATVSPQKLNMSCVGNLISFKHSLTVTQRCENMTSLIIEITHLWELTTSSSLVPSRTMGSATICRTLVLLYNSSNSSGIICRTLILLYDTSTSSDTICSTSDIIFLEEYA